MDFEKLTYELVTTVRCEQVMTNHVRLNVKWQDERRLRATPFYEFAQTH